MQPPNVVDHSSDRIRIAVDAMGGDFAPANEVQGAGNALKRTNNRFDVVLVGDRTAIEKELASLDAAGLSISIVHAPTVVTMHDSPVAALKQKPDSSLVVGMTLHKERKVDAFVSTSNTGAVTAASTLLLGRIPGVSRPTIGTLFPSDTGYALIADAGAVTDSKPHFLFEFGVMGSIFSEYILGKKNPRVGLLNVGEEESKGDERTKEAYKLFIQRADAVNFIGNIEGRDILKGKADVVVCDGFLGNVLLKFGESVPSFLKAKFKAYADRGIYQKLLMALLRNPLRKIFKDFDYQEYGGVPLLGVNGVTIIGHGRSTPKAIANMILRAEEMVQKKINTHIENTLRELQ
ncbi:MAG: phosphate acyltransferase PlsX [Ignavibacteriales bacterium]|nr:phosphate acyltransferase PlsX [Ignavibacteriales bacterium]